MTNICDHQFELVSLPTVETDESGGSLREMAFRANAYGPETVAKMRTMFDADMAISEIAAGIGRGVSATRSKICNLGWRRNSRRPWDDTDLSILHLDYGTAAPCDIALRIGRSIQAVHLRALKDNLTEIRPPNWHPWEDLQITAGYNQDVPVTQIAGLIGRSVSAIVSRAKKLGVRRLRAPHGWSDDDLARVVILAESQLPIRLVAQQISNESGIQRTYSAVKQVLTRYGYDKGWTRPWTDDEDEGLRDTYRHGRSAAAYAASIGRSGRSTASRAKTLGLTGTHPRKNGFLSGDVWTEQEISDLKAFYPIESARQVSIRIGRPLRSVYEKANRLGLRSRNRSR